MKEFKDCLREFAFDNSKARREPKKDDSDNIFFDGVNPFILDQMKVLQSKAYRRLEEKTQVFFQPSNPHVRTRATHTVEVCSLAVTVSDFLGLNTELTRAIALAHDIGHTPYGHVGETFLTQKTGKKFKHNAFGIVVAEEIERKGGGLNLTEEVKFGIYYHSGFDFENKIYLPECAVVRICDKICNTFSDLNDAIRFDYVKESDLPSCFYELGKTQRKRVANCLRGLFQESYLAKEVSFSQSETAKIFKEATEWMYENVYPEANKRITYEHLDAAYDYLQRSFLFWDYYTPTLFALMTEAEVECMWLLHKKRDCTVNLEKMGIMEMLPNLQKGKEYDPTKVIV